MPMYEYECEHGHSFEQIQKFSDDPIEICPILIGESLECGAKTRRLLSASNFALKGDGWYRDGYTKKAKEPAQEQASPPSDTNFKEVADRTRKAVLKRDFGVDG